MKRVAAIRCVAFDAVGTLIEPEPPAVVVYHQVAQRHGSRLGAEEIARRFRSSFLETERGDLGKPERVRLATSEALERTRWQTIVTSVIDDVADRDACFEELFVHFARAGAWRCFSDVPGALDALERSGIGAILASNFDGRLHTVCDGIPELRGITTRVISSEVGFRKPSREFFSALVSAAGCRPEELLMVGDDRINDRDGARDAGIPALLVNRRSTRHEDELGSLSELTAWLEQRTI